MGFQANRILPCALNCYWNVVDDPVCLPGMIRTPDDESINLSGRNAILFHIRPHGWAGLRQNLATFCCLSQINAKNLNVSINSNGLMKNGIISPLIDLGPFFFNGLNSAGAGGRGVPARAGQGTKAAPGHHCTGDAWAGRPGIHMNPDHAVALRELPAMAKWRMWNKSRSGHGLNIRNRKMLFTGMPSIDLDNFNGFR
jgi:hypothetical protein